ncbi:hypothetical protein HYH02_012311 [Chlamydomonas schloesseri]|uniref:Uncharacterized protein n=1 Tax=Chlamydomonas schloesseri TaxID=2026947 RepID=A0A835SW97_9CHLO|nr:hypothetical protein HYH02_012311 [Chlamydomonas schloesseri]|eukprot:KAG2434482.1 hypothetical protein HYH02_012311 [Chlamydomonas schloesseri]
MVVQLFWLCSVASVALYTTRRGTWMRWRERLCIGMNCFYGLVSFVKVFDILPRLPDESHYMFKFCLLSMADTYFCQVPVHLFYPIQFLEAVLRVAVWQRYGVMPGVPLALTAVVSLAWQVWLLVFSSMLQARTASAYSKRLPPAVATALSRRNAPQGALAGSPSGAPQRTALPLHSGSSGAAAVPAPASAPVPVAVPLAEAMAGDGVRLSAGSLDKDLTAALAIGTLELGGAGSFAAPSGSTLMAATGPGQVNALLLQSLASTDGAMADRDLNTSPPQVPSDMLATAGSAATGATGASPSPPLTLCNTESLLSPASTLSAPHPRSGVSSGVEARLGGVRGVLHGVPASLGSDAPAARSIDESSGGGGGGGGGSSLGGGGSSPLPAGSGGGGGGGTRSGGLERLGGSGGSGGASTTPLPTITASGDSSLTKAVAAAGVAQPQPRLLLAASGLGGAARRPGLGSSSLVARMSFTEVEPADEEAEVEAADEEAEAEAVQNSGDAALRLEPDADADTEAEQGLLRLGPDACMHVAAGLPLLVSETQGEAARRLPAMVPPCVSGEGGGLRQGLEPELAAARAAEGAGVPASASAVAAGASGAMAWDAEDLSLLEQLQQARHNQPRVLPAPAATAAFNPSRRSLPIPDLRAPLDAVVAAGAGGLSAAVTLPAMGSPAADAVAQAAAAAAPRRRITVPPGPQSAATMAALQALVRGPSSYVLLSKQRMREAKKRSALQLCVTAASPELVEPGQLRATLGSAIEATAPGWHVANVSLRKGSLIVHVDLVYHPPGAAAAGDADAGAPRHPHLQPNQRLLPPGPGAPAAGAGAAGAGGGGSGGGGGGGGGGFRRGSFPSSSGSSKKSSAASWAAAAAAGGGGGGAPGAAMGFVDAVVMGVDAANAADQAFDTPTEALERAFAGLGAAGIMAALDLPAALPAAPSDFVSVQHGSRMLAFPAPPPEAAAAAMNAQAQGRPRLPAAPVAAGAHRAALLLNTGSEVTAADEEAILAFGMREAFASLNSEGAAGLRRRRRPAPPSVPPASVPDAVAHTPALALQQPQPPHADNSTGANASLAIPPGSAAAASAAAAPAAAAAPTAPSRSWRHSYLVRALVAALAPADHSPLRQPAYLAFLHSRAAALHTAYMATITVTAALFMSQQQRRDWEPPEEELEDGARRRGVRLLTVLAFSAPEALGLGALLLRGAAGWAAVRCGLTHVGVLLRGLQSTAAALNMWMHATTCSGGRCIMKMMLLSSLEIVCMQTPVRSAFLWRLPLLLGTMLNHKLKCLPDAPLAGVLALHLGWEALLLVYASLVQARHVAAFERERAATARAEGTAAVAAPPRGTSGASTPCSYNSISTCRSCFEADAADAEANEGMAVAAEASDEAVEDAAVATVSTKSGAFVEEADERAAAEPGAATVPAAVHPADAAAEAGVEAEADADANRNSVKLDWSWVTGGDTSGWCDSAVGGDGGTAAPATSGKAGGGTDAGAGGCGSGGPDPTDVRLGCCVVAMAPRTAHRLELSFSCHTAVLEELQVVLRHVSPASMATGVHTASPAQDIVRTLAAPAAAHLQAPGTPLRFDAHLTLVAAPSDAPGLVHVELWRGRRRLTSRPVLLAAAPAPPAPPPVLAGLAAGGGSGAVASAVRPRGTLDIPAVQSAQSVAGAGAGASPEWLEDVQAYVDALTAEGHGDAADQFLEELGGWLAQLAAVERGLAPTAANNAFASWGSGSHGPQGPIGRVLHIHHAASPSAFAAAARFQPEAGPLWAQPHRPRTGTGGAVALDAAAGEGGAGDAAAAAANLDPVLRQLLLCQGRMLLAVAVEAGCEALARHLMGLLAGDVSGDAAPPAGAAWSSFGELASAPVERAAVASSTHALAATGTAAVATSAGGTTVGTGGATPAAVAPPAACPRFSLGAAVGEVLQGALTPVTCLPLLHAAVKSGYAEVVDMVADWHRRAGATGIWAMEAVVQAVSLETVPPPPPLSPADPTHYHPHHQLLPQEAQPQPLQQPGQAGQQHQQEPQQPAAAATAEPNKSSDSAHVDGSITAGLEATPRSLDPSDTAAVAPLQPAAAAAGSAASPPAPNQDVRASGPGHKGGGASAAASAEAAASPEPTVEAEAEPVPRPEALLLDTMVEGERAQEVEMAVAMARRTAPEPVAGRAARLTGHLDQMASTEEISPTLTGSFNLDTPRQYAALTNMPAPSSSPAVLAAPAAANQAATAATAAAPAPARVPAPARSPSPPAPASQEPPPVAPSPPSYTASGISVAAAAARCHLAPAAGEVGGVGGTAAAAALSAPFKVVQLRPEPAALLAASVVKELRRDVDEAAGGGAGLPGMVLMPLGGAGPSVCSPSGFTAEGHADSMAAAPLAAAMGHLAPFGFSPAEYTPASHGQHATTAAGHATASTNLGLGHGVGLGLGLGLPDPAAGGLLVLTPLHVALALGDQGRVATHILGSYPEAYELWTASQAHWMGCGIALHTSTVLPVDATHLPPAMPHGSAFTQQAKGHVQAYGSSATRVAAAGNGAGATDAVAAAVDGATANAAVTTTVAGPLTSAVVTDDMCGFNSPFIAPPSMSLVGASAAAAASAATGAGGAIAAAADTSYVRMSTYNALLASHGVGGDTTGAAAAAAGAGGPTTASHAWSHATGVASSPCGIQLQPSGLALRRGHSASYSHSYSAAPAPAAVLASTGPTQAAQAPSVPRVSGLAPTASRLQAGGSGFAAAAAAAAAATAPSAAGTAASEGLSGASNLQAWSSSGTAGVGGTHAYASNRPAFSSGAAAAPSFDVRSFSSNLQQLPASSISSLGGAGSAGGAGGGAGVGGLASGGSGGACGGGGGVRLGLGLLETIKEANMTNTAGSSGESFGGAAAAAGATGAAGGRGQSGDTAGAGTMTLSEVAFLEGLRWVPEPDAAEERGVSAAAGAGRRGFFRVLLNSNENNKAIH